MGFTKVLAITDLTDQKYHLGVDIRKIELINFLKDEVELDAITAGMSFDGVNVIEESYYKFFPKRFIHRFRYLSGMNLKDYDILQVECPPFDLSVIPFLKSRKCKVPVVLDYIDRWHLYPSRKKKILRKYLYLWEKYSAKYFCDKIFVLTEGLKNIVADYGISEDKIYVVPNGVDAEKFKPGKNKDSREKFNLDKDAFYVVYIGNISKIVNFPIILNAARALENITDIKFLIIGGNPPHALGEYKKFVRANEMENVLFMGNKTHDVVAEILPLCDVGIIPYPVGDEFSRYQTLKVLEYMACGLPVISTRLFGIKDILGDDYELFFESDNPSDLASKIKAIFDDEANKNTIGGKNRRKIEKKFSWKHVAKRILWIYDDII